MPTLLETLTSYVPRFVARRLAVDPTPPAEPRTETFPAAVLFADISGFTALTEQMAQRGPAGVEELTELLNGIFGQMIALTHALGGDVVKFAGDALIVVWPATEEDLATAARRAAQCGLALQATLRAESETAGLRLSVHMGLGVGDVVAVQIGGVYGRWESLLVGQPLTQVNLADRQAHPGDVVLSPEAWALVEARCTGQPLPQGHVRLETVLDPLPLPLPDRPSLSPQAEAGLRAFIPGAILARLTAGQTGWLAELRPVTVIFLNLPDLTYTTPLEQAQGTMRALQAALYQYEGSVNKINVDEKGASLVAALGLPPLAHEDDAVRGVQAAVAMQAALQEMDLRGAIGVTTGRAFCGVIGNDQRREYTMHGNVVNLAARLMQAARQRRRQANDPIPILCDEATHQAAQARLTFEPLAAITVKGRTEPVAIYRPLGQRQRLLPRQTDMVGRVREKTLLVEELQTLLRRNRSNVVVIEGEIGIGKSRLVVELLRHAGILGVTWLVGAGDAVEKSTPYHAWRPIFKQIFKLDARTDASTLARRSHVLALLPTEPELLQLTPLLNAVVSLDLADNDLTAQMSGELRANNTQKLLVKLLQAAAQAAPLLLILEDAHWLDSASWALAQVVSQEVRPALLVIVTRPQPEPPVVYSQLLKRTNAQHVRLDALSAAETEALVCQRLGVAGLPPAVAGLIRDKAEGHPFFSEELAYALRDSGLIHVVDGVCTVDPEAEDLRTVDFPGTIQGVITSRIDRLAPQQQFTLKVASVIGRVFAFDVLREVHPIKADRPHLRYHLQALERLNLTAVETPEPNLAYVFKHIITQEAAYNLMAFAQRRQLHRAVAEWLERARADELSAYYPLLAHHWSKAEVLSTALDYLEKAGEQAMRDYANEEAVRFFGEALALSEGQRGGGATEPGRTQSVPAPPHPGPTAQTRRARWHARLGEAYFLGLGRFPESRAHLRHALARLGETVPPTRGKLLLGLLGEIARQLSHRLWPGRFKAGRVAGEERETLLLTARTCFNLAVIYINTNQTWRAIYLGLRLVNLAERAGGASPELADGYASMCLVAGLTPFRFLARAYSTWAEDVAQRLDQPVALARMSAITSLHKIGLGQWMEMQATLEKIVEIYERLGDQAWWGLGIILLADTAALEGNTRRSLEQYNLLVSVARRRNNPVLQAHGLNGQALHALRRGQVAHAADLLAEALDLLAEETFGWPTWALEIGAYGQLALARLRLGQPDAARQAAEQAARRIAQASLTMPHLVVGYVAGQAGVAEVYLQLWENSAQSAQTTADGVELAGLAHRACQSLHAYRRLFPIWQPYAWLYQGWYEWLAGRPRRAYNAWRKSLAVAGRLVMPYEQGLAHYHLGRHLPLDDPARRGHLHRAQEIFTQVDALYDLARTQKELAPLISGGRTTD